MKKTKLAAIILAAIITVLLLAGCQTDACTHTDANADGVCDECGDAVGTTDTSDKISLIKDSKVNFQFVMQSGLESGETQKLKKLAKTIGSLTGGKDVKIEYDDPDTAIPCEILIGKISSRGDAYIIDEHYLGPKGYAIKVIDGKILVLIGGEEAFMSAIDCLEKEIFGITGATKSLKDIAVEKDFSHEYVQDDFTLKSVTVAGESLDGYVLSYDRADTEAKEAVTSAQKALYAKTGMWLELVSISSLKDGQRAVIVETIENGGAESTEAGARIFVDENKNLVIQSEFVNRTKSVATDFLINEIANSKKSSLSFDQDFTRAVEVRSISYRDSMFGAKGDGRTNDFAAIKACHDYANEYGHTVVVNSGTYYIGETGGVSITVKTDVDWTGAKFIFDDSFITEEDKSEYGNHIFVIKSDYTKNDYFPDASAEIGTIERTLADINAAGGISKDNFARFEHGLGYPVLIFLCNSEHKNYVRYGVNADEGAAQKELIYVSADGTVSTDTPLLFDYAKVTGAIVYRADDKQITIKGGEITTRANQMVRDYAYYCKRGIQIGRSNTVIDGLVHKIVGEGEDGSPYSGFLTIQNVTDVTVKNCILQAHKAYALRTNAANIMGTYDISPSSSNRVTFFNVTQSNFFTEDGVTPSIEAGYWGIMGGNDCKNLKYDTCMLTRFDSHRGTYNAKIINSSVSSITLIGGGDFTMENSTVYTSKRNTVISLRDDYGSIWHGTFTLKNVNVVVPESFSSDTFYIYSASWYNFDHGYITASPYSVTVENLTVSSPAVKKICLATGSATQINAITNTINPYVYTKSFIVTDGDNKYTYTKPTSYTETVITVNDEVK